MEECRRVFKYSIGEKVFSFDCDADAKIWEAKDALCHFISNVIDIEKKILEEMMQKQNSEPLAETSKE